MKDMILELHQERIPRRRRGRRHDARREHAAHLERHRRQLQHGEPEAVPREEVRASRIPDDEATPQAFDTVTSIIDAGEQAPGEEGGVTMAYPAAVQRGLAGRTGRHPREGHLQGRAVHPLAAGRAHQGRVPERVGAQGGRQPLREQLPRALEPPRRDRRRAQGARRARLRHVERAVHLRHAGPAPDARAEADRVPRHGGHDPLPELPRRQRRRVRGHPRPRRRDDLGPARARVASSTASACARRCTTPTSTATWRTWSRSSRSTRTSASA